MKKSINLFSIEKNTKAELIEVMQKLVDKKISISYSFGLITYITGILSLRLNMKSTVDAIRIKTEDGYIDILLHTIVSMRNAGDSYFFTLNDKSDFSLSLKD